MRKWKKSDIGKVIVYRKAGEPDSNKEFAICKADSYNNRPLLAVEYPLSLNSKIIYSLYLNKNNEVKGREEIKQPGDWYLEKIVSKEELEELKRIAKK